MLSPAEAAARIAAKAREHGVYIAAGLALDAAGGGYANGAALFGRDGELAARYDKSFLWHFDRRWFAPGDAYPVFETDFGRVGMLVCADGRLPEIARSLALNGAQIILDLTAWVSGGAARRRPHDDPASSTSCAARAAENGVWVACRDKFGIEAESIVYCGRSCFIDPRGEIRRRAGAGRGRGCSCTTCRSRMRRRRSCAGPELYDALSQPTDSLPVVRMLDEPFVMPRRTTTDRGRADDDAADGRRVPRRRARARRAARAAWTPSWSSSPATPSRLRARVRARRGARGHVGDRRGHRAC